MHLGFQDERCAVCGVNPPTKGGVGVGGFPPPFGLLLQEVGCSHGTILGHGSTKWLVKVAGSSKPSVSGRGGGDRLEAYPNGPHTTIYGRLFYSFQFMPQCSIAFDPLRVVSYVV